MSHLFAICIYSIIACAFPLSLSAQCSYEIYGKCLYLQPNSSALNYGVEAIPLPLVTPNWNTFEIDPDYHFGFEIGVLAKFQNNLNLGLSWERLHANDSASFLTSTNNMVGPFFDIGPNSSAYNLAKGKVSFHFDQIDLILGKEFCFSGHLLVNFYAGVSYANIKQQLKSSYFFTGETEEPISRTIDTPSKFEGAGPQIGIDYHYLICRNFSFVGNSNASLYMGRMKNHTKYISYTPELEPFDLESNVQKTKVPNRSQLVPGFEQSLGLSFATNIRCFKIAFEIGYQCQIYLDAIQTVDMTAPQVLPATEFITPEVGVYAVGFERHLSNFMLSGPYASINIVF